ncbi:MAG: HAD family phosphatase [Synechococcales cyanobacterium K44_A2020_017]|nr:HAD family phosphatase [Synechococcales cyanobacterium K32_A2020_035]MBF2093675.1 HAD family phosphatase [Synechococcales cyanobacterium K44_A2020_017]
MIRSLIFDLGGVIINLRYQTTIEAFSRLCGFDVSPLYTQHQQNPLFDRYEMGQISSAEFREGMRSLLGITCADDDIDQAWNAMLLDIPPSRVSLLQQLRDHYRLFLLSNTNEIHKAECDRIFAHTFGSELTLSGLFDHAYYSHEVGDRKPHASIFQRVLQDHDLDPAATLFIEDTKQHIDGAIGVGLQTVHLTGGRTIHDLGLMPK